MIVQCVKSDARAAVGLALDLKPRERIGISLIVLRGVPPYFW